MTENTISENDQAQRSIEIVVTAMRELFVEKDLTALDRYWAEPYVKTGWAGSAMFLRKPTRPVFVDRPLMRYIGIPLVDAGFDDPCTPSVGARFL
ncbi:hypothetical protein ACWDWU_01375 [Streptomyces sp. NPDC003442]